MSKKKIFIALPILLAAIAGVLVVTGVVGGGSKEIPKKHVVEPISLAEPFTVNLADTDGSAFLATNIAVKLKPMDEEHWLVFSGAGGGGHGGGEAPGPPKVAAYPKFRDAVITVASTFKSDRLLTSDGQAEFKAALLDKFHAIEQVDAAEAKAGAEDPAHIGPPYHIEDVYFTKYVVQKNDMG